jgi:hypothetical protein
MSALQEAPLLADTNLELTHTDLEIGECWQDLSQADRDATAAEKFVQLPHNDGSNLNARTLRSS